MLDGNPSIQLFYTVQRVAKRYGMSVDSIWRWRCEAKDGFPKPVRV